MIGMVAAGETCLFLASRDPCCAKYAQQDSGRVVRRVPSQRGETGVINLTRMSSGKG